MTERNSNRDARWVMHFFALCGFGYGIYRAYKAWTWGWADSDLVIRALMTVVNFAFGMAIGPIAGMVLGGLLAGVVVAAITAIEGLFTKKPPPEP